MQYWCDQVGFPLICLPQLQLDVQLLPVTKVQFERFLAQLNDFGDNWYESVLAINPRTSWRRFTEHDRERLFITGILPNEARTYAQWLGEGFDLPTVQEWRVIYQAVQRDPTFSVPLPELADQLIRDGNKVAGQIVRRLLDQLKGPQLWLMDGGLVEWARDDSTGQFVGLGSPRHAFYPNAWNPIADTVRPLAAGQRLYYFGMRVVHKPSRAATADSSVALW